MIGMSEIHSSMFINNNNIETRPELSNTLGGNVLIAYPDSPLQTRGTRLLISHSGFANGSDNSQEDQFNFHANGMGIITNRYIQIIVEDSYFCGNIGNRNFPSITVTTGFRYKCQRIEHSSINFLDCIIRNEGSFNIDSSYPITIENCLFSEGIGSGLSINFQTSDIVTITDCVFRGFKSHESKSIMEVQISKQDTIYTLFVNNSVFENNKMPCLNLSIEYESIRPSKYNSTRIKTTLSNCTFRENYMSENNYLVLIQQDILTVPLWEYKQSMWTQESFSEVIFLNTTFINNALNQYSYKAIVGIKKIFVSIENCSFIYSVGTALQANESVFSLLGENYFINNTGKDGGALSLIRSMLQLNNQSTTTLENNRANYGGGIFATPITVQEVTNEIHEFLRPIFNIPKRNCPLCTLGFHTNSAIVKIIGQTSSLNGNSVFNGAFQNCCIFSGLECSINFRFCIKTFSYITTDPHQLFLANSTFVLPAGLFFCRNNRVPSGEVLMIETFAGAEFNISVATIGEYGLRTPPAVLREKLCTNYDHSMATCDYDYDSEVRYGVGKRIVTNDCDDITYSIHTIRTGVFLEILLYQLTQRSPSLPPLEEKKLVAVVNVTVLPCPHGYEISNTKPYHCKCIKYLRKFRIDCSISQEGTILRPKQMWIGIDQNSNILLHKSCPFDYCISEDTHIRLTNANADQCSHNRSGVLCGGCQDGLSLVLGTSTCRECSNLYLFLIIPFALAGVALVILLLKCNLTVATGHINGLIFYANIVHINKPLLLSSQNTATDIFSTFVAWLNLDLGIETCFSDSMDAYTKVWLQFVFPIYLWVMVGVIIVLAHYSTRGGKLISNNSVPVLATLFVLSFAKLLRAIIAAVSFTFIESQDGSYSTVWLYDGNVQYMSPKHIALFLMAMVFMFGYILPLTILVTFSSYLQAKSHRKAFRWVNRLKPFLDAYQGPYKTKFQFWTGLMLFWRIILLTIFAANYNNDPSSINFFWITVIVGPIAMLCLIKGIYRNKLANFLEAVSLLNVVMLSIISWLATSTSYSKWQILKEIAVNMSLVIAMLMFLGILAYKVTWRVCQKYFIRKQNKETYEPPIVERVVSQATTTEVNLKELLLEF